MKKNTKSGLRKSNSSFSKKIKNIVQKNEAFLRSKSKETYDEIIELIKDSEEYFNLTVELKEKPLESYMNSAIVYYIYHILPSFSQAILTVLLMANLPACFLGLRLLLETLIKCYYADLKYPNQKFFLNRLDSFEKEMKKGCKSVSRLLKEYDKKAVALWGKLSGGWLHTRGIVDRIMKGIIRTLEGRIVTVTYTDTELDMLKELRENTSSFRELQKKIIKDWEKSVWLKDC